MSKLSYPAYRPLADPAERRIWLREALRPLRGAAAQGAWGRMTLRGRCQPEEGPGGATFAWLCLNLGGGLHCPWRLCLVEEAPGRGTTPRAEIGSVDFIAIYGPRAFLRLLATTLNRRPAAPAPSREVGSGRSSTLRAS